MWLGQCLSSAFIRYKICNFIVRKEKEKKNKKEADQNSFATNTSLKNVSAITDNSFSSLALA
jgi:hypothetical protein